MFRRLVAPVLVIALLAGCGEGIEAAPDRVAVRASSDAPNLAPATQRGTGVGRVLGSFSKDKAMRHIRALAGDIGVRVRATNGELRGARYIAERFAAMGYETKIQRFAVDSGTSRNVIAWWPGAMRYPVVIGGHMDTVARSPGANDNASGIAVILEMARLVAGTDKARFVRFVAFGSEEYGTNGVHHVGSQVFVNRLGDGGRAALAGMVSVDMIADGRPLIVGTSGMGPEVVARSLYRKIRAAGIAVRWEIACDCSDNGPFERAGIPGSYVWSGEEPNYHQPSDTVANMEPDDLLRTGRAIRAFILALDGATIRRFRES